MDENTRVITEEMGAELETIKKDLEELGASIFNQITIQLLP